MKQYDQSGVIESYRNSFHQHGNSAEALQWSPEGQRWRFDKLLEIITSTSEQSLKGKRVLEIGCGLGHMYPLICSRYGEVDYTGIDIVQELIDHAQAAYPSATFECRDIFRSPIKLKFDYVFISGVFNAPFRTDSRGFMSEMLKHAFSATRVALAFNFTSTHVNFINEGANYFAPDWVLSEVITKLSRNVRLDHNYRNCDVSVCVFR